MRPTDAPHHPPDWFLTTVRQSVEIARGVSWSKEQEHRQPRDDTVPVVRIGNVRERLRLDDLLHLSGIKPAVIRKKRVTAGWTVMVGSNGNRDRIGNAVLVREDSEFLFASFLLGTRPKDDSGISPEYFYRWLSTAPVQAYLSASAEGTTGLNNLSHSFFRAMAIPFPSRNEQAVITRILDAIDSVIERTRDALAGAQLVYESLLHEVLTRGFRRERTKKSLCGIIPKSWRCESLGQHLQVGPTNGVYRPESDYGAQGTRIVRIDSFGDGKLEDVKSLRRVVVPPTIQRRYALVPNQILINRVNSLSHIGKAAIVPYLDEATIFESNMMSLQCGSSVLPGFLINVLCSDVARRHWLARAKPAVNQASINQRDVRELPIPIPGADEQREIVQVLLAARAPIDRHQRVAAAQAVLKRALMSDLMTGRVRAPVALEQERAVAS